MTTAPLCFIDVETDGLHPGKRVWEVAMIRREPDRTADGTPVESSHHFFVGIDLRNSDLHGLQVGGFWDRHPSGRKLSGKEPSPTDLRGVTCKHDAAKEIMRVTFGTHLVGVNPAFDADTLTGLLRSEGYLPAWHYHVLDVSAMAMGWLNADASTYREGPVAPPWKSDELAAACGVEPAADSDRHTALGDARWAMRWYDALTGGVS